MEELKVSLIATVLNEEKTIRDFLESIVNQRRKPNEFIIVDGGSTDGTIDVIKSYSKKHKWIKLIVSPGATIGRGRNIAIKKAKNNVIVVCDAGTIYDKNWLKNLVEGFNGEVSFGIDLPLARTKFQKILGRSLCHRFKEGSSRNMIFLKSIWEEVGGYPEDLRVAEDTVFDEKIRRMGYKFSIVRDAICYWRMRENLNEVKRQFYNYGFWDGMALRKYKLTLPKHRFFIFLSPLIFSILIFSSLFTPLSLRLKIEFTKRINYLKGFYKALWGENIC
jgi:glycosyltransferase involved in cell wall biosynthesis